MKPVEYRDLRVGDILRRVGDPEAYTVLVHAVSGGVVLTRTTTAMNEPEWIKVATRKPVPDRGWLSLLQEGDRLKSRLSGREYMVVERASSSDGTLYPVITSALFVTNLRDWELVVPFKPHVG